ncbi:MAG TPA: Rap1a/Tai family immunity protein, partial [Alphaproteobacteria bacterium]|nr:Rap1a/Tai family immunity protein [Alphaproteobacteria bacterium]
MSVKTVLLAGIMLAALALPARAGFVDGNKLHQDCSSMLNVLDSSCAAYISAVADMLEQAPVARHRACLPPGAKLSQAVDVVKRWLADN